jgi:hypothetical protein
MQPDLIREIAEAIFRDQLLLNWRFYVLIGSFSFIAGMGGSFATSYLKKRGETFATKADMKEILRQLSVTTRLTEEVRSAVSLADWTTKEWQTIRRLKLEELLSAAYLLDQWLDHQRSKWLHDKSISSDEAPMERLRLLTALYFPELQRETTAVWLAHQNAFLFILNSSKQAISSRSSLDVHVHKTVLDEFSKGWKTLYADAISTIRELEEKASALMTEVARPKLPQR